METALGQLPLKSNAKVLILGAGGMSRACQYAVVNKGYSFQLWTRKGLPNWDDSQSFDVLINATPMVEESQFENFYGKFNQVVDAVVSLEGDTPLVLFAKKNYLPVVSGFELTVTQAARQFELYTGHPLENTWIAEAALFAKTATNQLPWGTQR